MSARATTKCEKNQVLKCNGGQAPSSVVKASSIAPAVKDPIPQKKPRGRPKATRYKSLAEKGYKTQQKKVTQTKATQQNTRQTQENVDAHNILWSWTKLTTKK